MTSQPTPVTEEKAPAVFDVASWLHRATAARPKSTQDYVPKHRAEGPAV